MRETLPQVSSPAVASERDRIEQHLHPPKYRVRLANDAMRHHCPRPDGLFVDVQFEVDAERELQSDRDEEYVGQLAVRAGKERPHTMRVPDSVASSDESKPSTLIPNVSQRRRVGREAHAPVMGHATGSGRVPGPFPLGREYPILRLEEDVQP